MQAVVVPASSISTILAEPSDARYVVRQSEHRPAPSIKILGPMAELPPDAGGAPSVAVPERWMRSVETIPELGVSILTNALVFGGTVVRRSGRFHSTGQLLLSSEGALLGSSFGLMDGHRSLSSTYLIEEANNNVYRFLGGSIEQEIEGDCIFLGSLHRHFGHFILEGLSRLWIRQHVELGRFRFCFYEPEAPGFARKTLELLGIRPDQLISVGSGARIRRLVVPDPAFRTHHWTSDLMEDVWDELRISAAERHPPQPRRVFLSRRRNPQRRLLEEERLEEALSERGFIAICPETLPIDKQIAIAAGADAMIGPVGSQMYLSLFMRRGTKKLILAPRNFFLADDAVIGNQLAQETSVVFGSSLDFQKEKEERTWSLDQDALQQILIWVESLTS